MKADPVNPRNLFDGNVHYEIPVFQRPYVWNEEDQWAPLWSDVERVATRVVRAGADADALKAIGGHFLGAVVYESKPPVVGDVTRHAVIDGQQRTTTLQILLDAVHQVIAERGHEMMAEDLEGLILNRSSAFKGRPERFKLWPSRGDREGFAQAMDPAAGWIGDHRIIAAHQYFRMEAEAWLAGMPDADGAIPPGTEEERVYALSSTLQHRLLVVAINLTGHDDAQLIFETLNDRGTPLLKADLIKNWIFQVGERIHADIESWPEKYWSDFDDDWWRDEIPQGRTPRSRIDIFLQYWLTMRTRDDVPTDEVFRKFVSHAEQRMNSSEGADGLLTEMRRDADTFRNFAQLDPDTVPGRFYSTVIEALELASTTPLFLWLLSENHQVPESQIEIGIRALESWTVRRTLLRYTTKDINKMMVAILGLLDDLEVSRAGDVVETFLAAQAADARLWPGDVELQRELPGIRLYGNVRQGRLRLVLEAAEAHLRTKRHEAVTIPHNLQVEHVMPRAWRSHWSSQALSPEDAEERDRVVDRLGNLTLVTPELNGTLSHRPWTDAEMIGVKSAGENKGLGKRALLNKYSLLVISRGIVDENPDSWTEENIRKRSEALASVLCEVWPGPPVAASGTPAPVDEAANEVSGVTEPGDEATVVATPIDTDDPTAPIVDPETQPSLEKAMKDVYVRAKAEVNYDAKVYLGMLSTHGGLGTARRLLHSPGVSDGFVSLWERGRVDLAVENVVVRPEFRDLFTDEELDIARDRLREYGLDVE